MAKMDIKQAYRNIPVHPDDRPLLGMLWEDKVYIDCALPFGLRSAPLIFTAVADAMQWIMERRGIAHLFHYIDDFITLGTPESAVCSRNSTLMHEICKEMGLPAEPEKDEGPATSITFLGMELDSMAMEIRLPREKLERMRADLYTWRGRKACKKRELLSLIGSLSHACTAVRAGRSFLRRLIDLSTEVKHMDHYVQLNRDARSDIEWWAQFSSSWNGVAIMQDPATQQIEGSITSDASGGWGCGAFSGEEWFMLRWSKDRHITAKELVPIVIAAAIWGRSWEGKTIQAWCDNAAVVIHIVNHGSSRNQEAMHLARCLAFIKAKLGVNIVASHIKRVNNVRADALSRNNPALFRSLHPQALQTPSSIPEALLDLLIVSKPDWTSRRWTELWSTIFQTA